MKHSTRFAALMTAALIFAFLPSAQVCGQSHHRSGGGGHPSSSMSSSRGGGSHSHSSSHGGSMSSGSSHRSGGSVSSGSSHHRSGGSVSSPGSSVQRHGGSSGRPSASVQRHGGSSERPSASAQRPGSVSRDRKPSGSSGVRVGDSAPLSQRSGSIDRRPGGDRRPSSGDTYRDYKPLPRPERGSGSASRDNGTSGRPHADGQQHGGRPGSDAHHQGDGQRHHDGVYPGGARRPGGGRVDNGDRAHRPGPGSRPYADGTYGPGRPHGTPAHVRVHPRPGSSPAHRPAPREFHGRPSSFHHYGHHHYGHYIPSPPPHLELRHYWGRNYYYYDNIWYRYHSGRYWICRPPWGYAFTPLADAVYTACAFAYYFDRLNYYDIVNDNARTITAQNETIAANNAIIASQNETIARGAELAQASGELARSLGLVQSYADAGTEYFYNDGVFYVKTSDGQYQVIVPPAGALVDSLPEDYEIIELGGATYYKVDDTVYRMTVIDGKAVFEVLGQLIQ